MNIITFMQKALLFVILIMLALSLFFYTKKQPSPGTSGHPEDFRQTLNDQETAAWDLLATHTSITKDQCLQKKQQQLKTYTHSVKNNQRKKRAEFPALKQETIELVRTILRDFNVDPKTIEIAPLRGLGESAAAADDYTIYVNEHEFCRFTPEASRFCIAHEIQHLKNRDHSTLQALASLARTAKCSCKNVTDFDAALNNYKRFIEIRADMQALLDGGPAYAQGAFELMDKLWELDGCRDNLGITHPKTSHRIATAQNICSRNAWNVTT